MFGRCKHFAVILACSTYMTSTPSYAQEVPSSPDISARLNLIEQELASKMADIANLEEQLKELRNLLTEPQKETTPPPMEIAAETPPIGSLTNAQSLDQALNSPNDYFKELGASSVAKDAAVRALNNSVSQPIFDRPNLPAGLSAALTLGNSSEASINFSYPVFLRKAPIPNGPVRPEQAQFRPQIGTFSASITTPLQSGAGTLFTDTARGRFERSSSDIPSGTRLRLGFDFLSFPKIFNKPVPGSDGKPGPLSYAARRRVVDVLFAANEACLRHYGAPSTSSRDTFYAAYDAPPPVTAESTLLPLSTILSDPPIPGQREARESEVKSLCSGDNLTKFIVGQRRDSTTPSGNALINPALARNFLGAFWNSAPLELPIWGWGLSGEIGTTDFAYQQANSLSLAADNDAAEAGFPGRFNLSVDPAAGFGSPQTDSRNFWTLRGYGLFSLFRSTPKDKTPTWFFPGITLVGSAEYASSYSFRPGTDGLTICPAQDVDPLTMEPLNVSVRCRAFNVDAPVRADGATLAGEARFRFLNVPLLNTLSFAPRYSYRLDDGAQIIDVPIYLQNDANGFGSAGIRFRHRWGGIDLLGNSDFKASEIAIFFVPLRFNGL